MVETLNDLLHEAQNELSRRAEELDRTTTRMNRLNIIADEIAGRHAASACVYTEGALKLLLRSGDDGLGMLTAAPEDVYGGDSPLTLIARNIQEWLYNELYDHATLIISEWEEEAELAAEEEVEPDLSGNFMKAILDGESSPED